MKRQPQWWSKWIYFLSIGAFFLFAIGFGMGVQEVVHPTAALPTTPSTATTSAPKGIIVGLGDSLTRGIGDSSGQGYFGLVRQGLQRTSKQPVTAINLAISGQTSSQLLPQVKQQQVQQLVKNAGWITITIGGNDLFRGSGGLEKIDEQAAERSRVLYEQNLFSILAELRQQNSHATILVLGLYNPFGDLPDEKRTSRFVADWNQTMEKVASRFDHVVVVPTADLFQLEPNRYLYSDHFHPNQAGYERIAVRLLQLMSDQPEGGRS